MQNEKMKILKIENKKKRKKSKKKGLNLLE
jgi:hypothetical protein